METSSSTGLPSGGKPAGGRSPRRSRLLGIVLAGTAGTVVYTLIAGSITSINMSFLPSPQYIIAAFLYWPSFAFAIFAVICAICYLVRKREILRSSLVILLSIPMLVYGSYLPRYPYLKSFNDNQRKGSEAEEEATRAGVYLMQYYWKHPDRFHYIGADDEVDVTGFIDFLRAKDLVSLHDDDAKDRIIYKENSILSPVGEPLIFLLDRHHDGYLYFRGQKTTVNGYENPWEQQGFGYTSAVGVVVRGMPRLLYDKAADQPLTVYPINDLDYKNDEDAY